ncbi:MAG: hypothetical protein EHM66_00515 [Deltaproteobacteria bacterium]|nr:MAG: hypothetical protein EHM66_00515 [Deltaproteobacteria bacterium]
MTNEEFFDIGRVAYITGNVQEALAAKQALELVVENANSLQQLKAEIAALNASIKLSSGDLFINKINVSERLRQLSAV